jgi:DNA helicase-2/ATP-dependent DNA helicase PcrA
MEFLSSLNANQLQAVKQTNGSVLILAGAGTGKTKVLTSKIAYIILNQLASPQEMLAVTFTNKAAGEISHRVNNIVNASGIWIGTFHSNALKILRSHANLLGLTNAFVIVNDEDQERLLKDICINLNLDAKTMTKLARKYISNWKDQGLLPHEIKIFNNNSTMSNALEIYKRYQASLLSSNAIDLDDIILYNVCIFKNNQDVLEYYQTKFKYIFVDEFQDTNSIQFQWVKMLSAHHGNICVVGDDDQAIYGWRGANVKYILDFPSHFLNTSIIKLEQNYRSTKEILEAASSMISNNKNRHDKTIWSDYTENNKVCLIEAFSDRDEAQFIVNLIKKYKTLGVEYNKCAILLRSAAQSRLIEDAFIANNIPYKIIGGLKFYDRMEIRDSIAYIRLAINNHDNFAFERIINKPKRSVGAVTLDAIKNYAQEKDVSYFQSLEEMVDKDLIKGKVKEQLLEFMSIIKLNNYKNNKPYESTKNLLKTYTLSLSLEQSDENKARLDNINELMSTLYDFNSIHEFLDHVNLVIEKETGVVSEEVNVMTIHASKGLEYDLVVIPCAEEGMIPNQRSINEQGTNGLEEERRLFYVALTRAKRYLYITNSQKRKMFADFVYNERSRFIDEISKNAIKKIENKKLNTIEYSAKESKEYFKKDISFQGVSKQEKPKVNPKKDKQSYVIHTVFGLGTVISKEGGTLTIAFKDGIKKIKQNYVEFVD